MLAPIPAEYWLRNERAEAAFTPSDGLNCSAFRVRLPSGQSVSALAEAPSWESLRARPSFYGNPILSPFAYGVKDSTLRYHGKEHVLSPTRWGRVAHGLVRDHPWTVERTTDTEMRASLTTQDDPQKLAEYPYPFSLTLTYTLSHNELKVAAAARNLGTDPMPFGFGIHPYVPLPLGTPGQPTPDSGPQDEIVTSDATRCNADGPGASGTPRVQLPPVEGAFDLRRGQSAAGLFEASRARRDRPGLYLTYAKDPGASGLSWSLASPRQNAIVEIETSPELWAMVLFAPATAEVISPVIGSCLPGFLDHTDDPARSRDLGLIELAPGATWTCGATFRVRPLT
jgi:galactose mutarotase-like enzyme